MRRTLRRNLRRRRTDTILDAAAPLALGVAALIAVALRPRERPDPWLQVRNWAPLAVLLITAAGSYTVVTQRSERAHADSYTLVRVSEQVSTMEEEVGRIRGMQEEVGRIRLALEQQAQDRYTASEAERDRADARRERLQLQGKLDELTRRVGVLEGPR